MSSPLPLALLLVLFAGTLSTSSSYPEYVHFRVPSHGCPPGFAEGLLTIFNEKRAKENLPALKRYSTLDWVAEKHAHHIEETDELYPKSDHLEVQYFGLWWGQKLTDQTPLVDTKNIADCFLSYRLGTFTEEVWKQSTRIGLYCMVGYTAPSAEHPSGGTKLYVTGALNKHFADEPEKIDEPTMEPIIEPTAVAPR